MCFLNTIRTIVFILIVLFFHSCATIKSKNIYAISIQTKPYDAKVRVTDVEGKEVFKSIGKDTVLLRADNGYFKRAHYSFEVSKDGYHTEIVPVYFVMDPKYVKNIYLSFFMPIGFFVVDPISGSMWMPEKQNIQIELKELTP